jgi:protoporphyrinogen oxidase
MKYAIIGGGISGLSIAHLLKGDNEVVVFESDSRPGGLIKCDVIEANLFHRTGGHVFNTKREDVKNWFWSFFDKDDQFIKAVRNSSVFMANGKEIPYPIENHAYLLDKEAGAAVVRDIVSMVKDDGKEPVNFEEFLQSRFGGTLYNLYFKPYNEKVWRRDLTKVPLSWLEGKLPMPTVEEIIYNNMFHVEEKAFVHSSFFYPRRGGSQFIADILARGLNIRYNQRIEKLSKTIEGSISINGEQFERIVFCGNVKQLPSLLADTVDISGYVAEIDQLEYHGTTTVFCEIDKNPYSWIYMPSREHESHRIICTGNFSPANNAKGKMTGTIEFTDYISEEAIRDNLTRIPLNPKYISHHYEKYTYPIQDKDTRQMVLALKDTLAKNNIYLCGRFAEWEYANMDVCIGSAMDLFCERLK